MIWYKEPKILFAQSRAHYFFPQEWMTPVERQNALARLILYTAALLFIIRRDSKVFVLAALALAALYLVDQNSEAPISNSEASEDCTLNPTLIDRRPRCDDFSAATAFPANWPVNQHGIPMQHTGMGRPAIDRRYQIPQQDLASHAEFMSKPTGPYQPRGAYMQMAPGSYFI